MEASKLDLSTPSNWKDYLISSLSFLAIFYVTTFSTILFIKHHGNEWLVTDIFVGFLYIFIFTVSIKILLRKLPMAAIFLAAPTIPLFMLMMVISMMPVMQLLDDKIDKLMEDRTLSLTEPGHS